jgi:hypothetical protein
MEACMEGKLFDLHKNKSCFMMFGNSEQRDDFQKQIKDTPIKLYMEEMKENAEEKYLGDIIHSGGTSTSVAETVKDRYGKIISGVFEICQVVDDAICQTVGGAKAGLELWESSNIPSLLNNC